MKAVLFDATGTLIELREPVGETYARLARDYGVDLPAWRLDDAFARVFRSAPPMVFPGEAPERIAERERRWWRDVVRGTFRASDGSARFSDFDAFFGRLYRHFSGRGAWRERPGAAALLAWLRARGLRTGVVSNFDQRLENILQVLGLLGLLDVVVTPCEAAAEKPDGRIFALALARLGVGPGDAVFVGDHPTRDLEGARAAGLRAVDVNELATFSELPERLARLGVGTPATGVEPR